MQHAKYTRRKKAVQALDAAPCERPHDDPQTVRAVGGGPALSPQLQRHPLDRCLHVHSSTGLGHHLDRRWFLSRMMQQHARWVGRDTPRPTRGQTTRATACCRATAPLSEPCVTGQPTAE
eukprot:4733681-Alexandrium_andersonii.AAC.1